MNISLSDRVQRIAPSATMAVAEQARALRAGGADVIDFSAGQPDFDTPDVVKQAAVRALEAGDTKYASPAGGRENLRRAICAYLARYAAVEYTPDQVCVTIGAKDALHLAFAALLNPGDEVLIPAPFWVSYPEQVKLMGAEPVIVPGRLDQSGKISPEALRRHLTPRTRMLVLNSPNNPSGAVYSRRELESLAAVVRDSDILVIADEIYHRLVYGEAEFVSFASLDGMHDRTITVNGCSKSFAMTGWRVGFAAGPKDVIKAIGRLIGQTTSGAPSFIQAATISALEATDEAVAEMRTQFAARRDRMCAGLNDLPGVECPRPDGAFYCFPDVSGAFEKLGAADASSFAEQVLGRSHVALVSGVAFGTPTHVRLSYATSMELIERGLERLAELLR